MKKKLFLISYGAGHISMIASLYGQFSKDNKVKLTVLALSIAKNHLKKLNIPHKTLANYSQLIMDGDAYRYGKKLADRWHVDSTGITYNESVVYLGASMRDLVNDFGKSIAFDLINKKGRQIFLPIWTIQQIIEYESPDLILTTNAPRMERACTIVGNKKNIPTINLHDDLGFMKRDYIMSGDKISVMSHITKKNLIKQGHDPSKIVINGHPAFDSIPNEMKNFNALNIRKHYSLSKKRPCLLLGTSMVGEKGKIMDITKLVCDAVQKLDNNYQLIIKPHPGEDADAYKNFAESHPILPKVICGVNIRELIYISKILITFKSTIMIESVLMSKPIISVNLTRKPNPLPFIKWGLGVEVCSLEQFVDAVDYILRDLDFKNKYNKARMKYFGNNIDGKACKRIANLAYSLAD